MGIDQYSGSIDFLDRSNVNRFRSRCVRSIDFLHLEDIDDQLFPSHLINWRMSSNDDYPACSCSHASSRDRARASMAGPSNVDFRDWVKKNGGDYIILVTLAEFGFSSRLSLRFLDLDSQDGIQLLSSLNFGQKCLLQGLIGLSKLEVVESASIKW